MSRVTERVMQPGSFTLELYPGTPSTVLAALTELGTVHITPNRLPDEGLTVANVTAAARYSGVYLESGSPYELAGEGLLWYLGGGRHAGNPVVTDLTFSGVALSSALATLLPAGSPLLPGTVSDSGLSTITTTLRGTSRRQALAQLCALAGASFVVRPDGYVNASLAPFVSSPSVVITSGPSSWLGTPTGIEAAEVSFGRDAGQYATDVTVVAQTGDGASYPTATAAGSDAYLDLFGNYLTLTQVVNAPTTPSASAAGVATAALSLATVRRRVSISCRGSDPRTWIAPGDQVYVYDAPGGVYDTANRVVFNGEEITPLKVRVEGVTWPVTRQHGVYFRAATGTGTTVLDISDWVVYSEDETTELDLGAGLSLETDTQLGVGFGDWQEALVRMNGAPTLPWTPSLTASTTNPTLGSGSSSSGYYWISDGKCFFQGSITFGTSGVAAGSGTYQISGLPVTPKAGRATFLGQVRARLSDASVPKNCWPGGTIDDSGVIRLRYPGTWPTGADVQVSSTAPWTWAASDRLEFEGSFPVL